MSEEWRHGLCGCCDSCGVCLCSWLLPCYQFGKNAEAVGDSCCICALCFMIPVANCVFHCANRGKLRAMRNIDGGCLTDVIYTMFCPFCALAQEGQEVMHMEENSMSRS